MPQLHNAYTVSDMTLMLQTAQSLLNQFTEALPACKEAARRSKVLDAMRLQAYTAGLFSFGLHEPADLIRAYFKTSLDACLELFHIEEGGGKPTPIALLEGISLGLLLNEEEATSELAVIGRQLYSPGPYTEGHFEADEIVMAYLLALLAGVRGEKKEAKDLVASILSPERQVQEPFHEWFSSCLYTLVGILDQDQSAFDEEVEKMLRMHQEKALYNELREDPAGLFCLNGMALSALAQREGLVIHSNSPYLPRFLLGNSEQTSNEPKS